MAIPGILCLSCPALPAAPGRLLIPISSTLSPWGLGGMDEDWRYIVSHSTEVTLQEEGSASSQAGHHGDLLPWNLPCPEGDRQNLPAQTSWPRGSCQHLGEGFGRIWDMFGTRACDTREQHIGTSGVASSVPKFQCQVSSPAAAPKPHCLRFQPS